MAVTGDSDEAGIENNLGCYKQDAPIAQQKLIDDYLFGKSYLFIDHPEKNEPCSIGASYHCQLFHSAHTSSGKSP